MLSSSCKTTCVATIALLLLCIAFEVQAKSLVSNTLGSHMVLQRAPLQARLWGWTKQGGEKVEVTFDGTTYPTVSSTDGGAWRVDLPPRPAGGPYVIKIVSSDGDSAVLEDIYFGDVYICSGQSNMQFTVPSAFNASEEIAKANRYPHIRLFTVGQATISQDPLEELATIEQPWSVADGASVGHGQWSYFSALCWFFGRDLYDQYQIPIGLVSTNWGGTIVQAWSSSDALAKCGNPNPKTNAIATSTSLDRSPSMIQTQKDQRVQVNDDNGPSSSSSSSVMGSGAPNPNQNSVLWNAMIVPYLPMRIRGAIWYQGESNVGNPKYYGCAFPEMIKDWRDKWQLSPSQMPFLFIQLAAYTQGGPYGYKLAETRYAQTKALSLPYVGMATAIDLGDLDSPAGNIHPRNKQALGYRSKLIADRLIYGGDQKVIYSGPVAKNVTVLSEGPAAVVRVHFFAQDAEGDRQPVLVPSSCPPSLKDTKECGWYDILTSSGKAFNATMVSVGEKGGVPFLELRAAVGSSEKAVGARYAYADWPVCTLYNKAGLPAPPFVFPPPF